MDGMNKTGVCESDESGNVSVGSGRAGLSWVSICKHANEGPL